MDLVGTYGGVVEDNRDPEKLGRLKVRVPHVFGAVGGLYGGISTENIPWAMPLGLPAGLTHQSGGMDWLPNVGDPVMVRFLDGEPEKPVWEWSMQTQESAKSFKLHSYDKTTNRPNRGALTRYGHTVEWNDSGIIVTTSKGYRMLFTDADVGLDGDILIETQAGQSLEFDDLLNSATLNVNQDFYINVGEELLAICGNIQLNAASTIGLDSGTDTTINTGGNLGFDVGVDWDVNVGADTTFSLGGDIDINAAGLLALKVAGLANISITGNTSLLLGGDLTAAVTGATTLGFQGALAVTGAANITMTYLKLLLGAGASEPFVLGTQLQTFLSALLAWLQAHVHTSTTPGDPTSPPTIPVPVLPTILSTTIIGS